MPPVSTASATRPSGRSELEPELPKIPATPGSQASSDRAVPTRRISFAEALADLPRHFAADGDLISSHLAASLSSVFPDGEDFFVRSVRHYRADIADPTLRTQVAGFIGQEATHGREHRALNDRLHELGYPVRRYERSTKRGLAVRERLLPSISNLALTAALEHFTATLAELVLRSDDTRRLFGHDALRDVFVWHSLEECEHKAVAFDVYQAVGGSPLLRVFTMKTTRAIFMVVMTSMVVGSLVGDPATYRRGVLRASWRRFRQSPLMQREVWRQLREYDRPGFHPDDSDTDALLASWRDELFGHEGRLNAHLVGAAATA